MSKYICLVKFYNNKDLNIKINIKQIIFKNNDIIFKEINLYELKKILNCEHNINTKNLIFLSKGIILTDTYKLKKNDIILTFNKNDYIFDICNNNNNIINENNIDIDIDKYNNELKYLKIYPEIIPFIYLIKESPIYLESFLKELKNTESILYDIIRKNEKLFINLFNIPDKIIKKLIEYSLIYNKEEQVEDDSSSDELNNMLSSSEINEQNSIIIDLDENENEIDEISLLFPTVKKTDIINYYNIFNFNKENVINFIYENYDI